MIAPEPGGAGQHVAPGCQRCGRHLVRRSQAYQVVAVAGLGAGRSAIAVRVGVN